jgi:hypothetical protein
MERAMLGRTKRLFITGAAVVLAGCSGSGSPETDLPDSAALTVPGEPGGGSQPALAESVARAPSGSPAATSTPPAQRTPAQSEPVLKQPPPPRDTRPSIPWPPDTISLRRDTL